MLQSHVLDGSVAIDEQLGEVLAKMINYRALTASVNEHLTSGVAGVRHDLAQLMEDTGLLIAFMDSSLDFAFARYDLLREIVLDLAHSFVSSVSLSLIAVCAFCFLRGDASFIAASAQAQQPQLKIYVPCAKRAGGGGGAEGMVLVSFLLAWVLLLFTPFGREFPSQNTPRHAALGS